MEYFNTYGGNPVSCAVGMAVLDVVERRGLRAHALRVGGYLLDEFRTLAEHHAIIGDVRGRGLFLGVELVKGRETKAPATEEAGQVVERLKEERILMSTDGPWSNVLKMKPPMVFSMEDAKRVAAAVDRALDAID